MFRVMKFGVALLISSASLNACEMHEEIEVLSLDVVSYEALTGGDEEASSTLRRALYEKGIVGVRGIPGYREKVQRLIEAARKFSALPEEAKEAYAREEGEMFLGYESGKEKFQLPDGKWVVDTHKASYYGIIPNHPQNKWPVQVDLQTPFQAIGAVMFDMGKLVMEHADLLGEATGISADGVGGLGRMLHYKNAEGNHENPYWCGSHFDHGLFTVLLPAFYFADGEAVDEPEEAGLFVKVSNEGVFKKVCASDPDVLLFQVGEFGQLATNDGIRATEHRVHKAKGPIERYTMALFYNAPWDTIVHSTSVLTEDARYGGTAGESCSYTHWNEASFKRYVVNPN